MNAPIPTRFRVEGLLPGTAREAFAYLDDIHHIQRHAPGMLVNLTMEVLGSVSRGVGTTYRWRGRILWWRVDFTETVVEWVLNRRKHYKSTSGLDFVFGWSLQEEGRGTHISMVGEFVPHGRGQTWVARWLLPWLVPWGLRRFLAKVRRQLARQSIQERPT
jgi:hypothetical protein